MEKGEYEVTEDSEFENTRRAGGIIQASRYIIQLGDMSTTPVSTIKVRSSQKVINTLYFNDIIFTFNLGRYIMYSQVSARQLFRAGMALHQSRHVDVELEFVVS